MNNEMLFKIINKNRTHLRLSHYLESKMGSVFQCDDQVTLNLVQN